MNRVAVQAGGASLRVAAEGRLLAALPTDGDAVAPVLDRMLGRVLDGLLDGLLDELRVVLPAAGPVVGRPPPVRAGVVRAVPAPVAALAEHAASTGAPLPRAVVVDAGHRGTEVARVDAGRVVAVRRVAVGGERLDALTAGVLAGAGAPVSPARARRVREALSLLPAGDVGVPAEAAAELPGALAAAWAPVIRAVRDVAGVGPPVPVLLIGGLARGPLLAELLDAAGLDDVRVAPRPDTTAVTGALRLPGQECPGWPGDAGPAVAPHLPSPLPGPSCPSLAAGPWLPPVVPARRRRGRTALGVLVAGTALASLVGAGAALPGAASSGPARNRAASGEVVQYGYAVDLPAGWAHTGGLPERRRSLLTPVSAPDGSDLISVERTPLGYDADAEPRRVRTELRATFDAAVAAGAPLSGFDDAARFAGRPVVAYREGAAAAAEDPAVAVDWYVVLVGDAQLSVGCRHTPAGAEAVRAACATVVGSLRRTA